ncbi:UDP-N-acetylmuramate--L-alanine ligase [Candidatus Parcubacteria bacterium]|nr:MAG: UDP-N-acetylmuramate--L-alanine ligase [Candidatus Parcubacteria bacterium]
MQKQARKSHPLVHFVGIGGIGMSALARWFLAQNWAVSGSDIARSSITRNLKEVGSRVKIGHKKANLSPKTALLIYSQAIPRSNPELQAGKELGVPALAYPEAIGLLTTMYTTVAVAGAHGKSTSTAILALILEEAGFDPTVIVGTNLKEFGNTNFRRGKSKYLVLEADEWKASFLSYSPAAILVTNVDKEHLDFYKNIGGVKNAFLKFIGRVRRKGIAVLNKDSDLLASLQGRIARIARKNGLRIFWYSLSSKQSSLVKKTIRVPGKHNVSNALGARTLARALGVPEKAIRRAISKFRGSWRRMEYRGKFRGAMIFDDYAHHPTEIRATLQAFREKYPGKKILCVFQPHQAKRLAALFGEFRKAFDGADETFILPVYEVAGRDSVSARFGSRELVRAIQAREPKKLLFYLEDPKNLKRAILSLSSPLPRKIIVMMGAGDIVNRTPLLVRR